MFTRRPDQFVFRDLLLTVCLVMLTGCGGGGSDAEAKAPASSNAAPPTPTGLSATPGNAQASLSWSTSNGASSYSVKRATTSGGPYAQVAVPTSTSYIDTSLTNGITYYYVVSALKGAAESANSAQVSALPVAAVTVPAAPTGLSATPGNTQVSLSWSASSGATSYHVRRGSASSGPYTQVAAPTSASYTDTSLSNGTTYYYVVTALNTAGESANSSQVSALPVAAVTIPAPPIGLSATAGNAQVSLSWSTSNGATSYHVKRATASSGPYTQLAVPTSTSYTDTSSANATTYYYVVTALNSAGESANSTQVSATPAAPGTSTITIVQSAVKDPAPNNVDSYDTGSGNGNAYAAQSAEFTANTKNGSTLLAFSTIAYDGQYRITNVSDPVNGNWTFVGELLHSATPGNNHIGVYAKFNAAPLLTTSWSGTGSVSSGGVLTIGSGTGTFRIGQRILSAHTPVPDNAQAGSGMPSVDNIVTVVSLLSGTLGAPGSTYKLNPNIGSVIFASEAMTTRDFVSAMRFTPPPPQVVGDYPGTWMLELSGTGANAYFSGHNDTPGASGTDTVTSGAISAPNVPGLVIGFTFNGGINFAPEPAPYPIDQYWANPGTGWTNNTHILAYNLSSSIVTVEWKHVSNINGQVATFSPPKASDYSTVVVAIPDGS